MIREGKKAEFIYCKQGKTLAPVAGCTRSPFSGSVRNGEEHVRTVKEAIVITAKPEKQEEPASLQQIPAEQSFVREAEVQQASLVTALQNSTTAQRIVCKDIHCSSVRNDITLKKLFHI